MSRIKAVHGRSSVSSSRGKPDSAGQSRRRSLWLYLHCFRSSRLNDRTSALGREFNRWTQQIDEIVALASRSLVSFSDVR
jgi:hypothetical protein